jgi:hypothetical protein
MIIQTFKNKPFTFWVFLLASLVFSLSTAKHFVFESNAEKSFYLFEIISFVVFLIILFLIEKQYLQSRKEIIALKQNAEIKHKEYQAKTSLLEKKLFAYEMHDEEARGLIRQQEKIIAKIFERKKDLAENHSFLHYFSEAVQGMAAILYVETKPLEGFTVKEIYGLPDGYTPGPFRSGEGLNGQAALEGQPLLIEDLPENYLQVSSGLGKAAPSNLYILPILKDKNCVALIELATFKKNDLEKIWPAISDKIIDKGVL